VSEVDVRARLPGDLLWLTGLACLWLTWSLMIGLGGPGVDSHAYWMAWRGDMYKGAPATYDAYLYSPAFAQVVWPLTQLPWSVFATLWSASCLAVLVWLVRPCRWQVAVPLLFVGAHEVVSGNINWLLAVVVVLGQRHAWLWAVPLLTKIAPGVGPLWFLVRREWRPLVVSIGSTVAVVAVSWALAPHLWQQWVELLVNHSGSTSETLGGAYLPPLAYRAPVVVALTVWAARTDRSWLLPVAMLLASPVAGPYFALLLAIPRLRRADGIVRNGPGPAASGRRRDRRPQQADDSLGELDRVDRVRDGRLGT
jgi:Glycosyltransferase family 87